MAVTLAEPARASAPAARSRAWPALAAVLVFALALRVALALRKSLVLDEFHTLFHATRESWASFLDTLLQDNHPPLSFLIVGAARALLGESEIALRAPAIVCGLAEIALVWLVGARAFGARAGALAALLLGASSLHLDFSTQARMYAELALAVTAVTAIFHDLLARDGASARGAPAALVVACWVGMHAHYFFLHYALVLGAVALVLLARGALRVERPRAWIVALLVLAMLVLPWFALGFPAQLGHGLDPGGRKVGVAVLAESFAHLFFLNTRITGPLRPLFLAAAAGVLALAAAGALELWRGEKRERALGIWLAAAAWGVPAFATLLAFLWPRGGFAWHYVLPSAAPMALLAARGAAGARARVLRAGTAAAVLAAAAVLSGWNVVRGGTEDYRGAVRTILDEWRPGDLVIAVEWQPGFFWQGAPWDYYARRAAGAPERLAIGKDFDLAEPADLAGADRVFLLATSLGPHSRMLQRLRERFAEESERSFGYGLHVRVFDAPRAQR